MRPIVLDYPYWRPSFEPRHLKKEAIWTIGETAREQICGPSQRPKIPVAHLMARTRKVRVNGIDVDLCWEIDGSLEDEFGQPTLGCTSHDERWPNGAVICLNGKEIGERDDLARSTAAHELGHGVFEVPAWIARCGRRATSTRRPQAAKAGESDAAKMEWSEWRANEFMGALIAPPRLLHRHAHKRAAALGVPMTSRGNGLPIVNGRKASSDAIEVLATELAEIFGVSIAFIQVRMQKYRLISPC
jgi:hypothetical protein